jgi:formate hydrogenlyase subunit 3/multisubunit Na+/H+ antiporter MnhD subunit
MAVAFYATHHALAKGALFLAVGLVAVSGGRRRLWLVLLPALVLSLGFGGMPGTGGALAKAAVKPQLGAGLVGLLSALSAAGSTLLMLHFLRRLDRLGTQPVQQDAGPALAGPVSGATVAAARPAPMLLLPWLGLATAAVFLPWALYAPLGLGDPWNALSKDPVAALWPLLLGAALAAALARWGHRLGTVPEGDLLLLAGKAGRIGDAAGAAVGRVEAALRAWPAAGLALLAIIVALFGAMLQATR